MVESTPLPEGTVRFPHEMMRNLYRDALQAAGVREEDANLCADVLISADLRGIRSHGAGRLQYFIRRLESGVINRNPDMKLVMGSDTTGVLDADNGLGIIASNRGMEEAMKRADKHGSGFIAIRNSSHFGYAGAWARKAMLEGFIGISMSNGGRRVTPTFGREGIFGTNPFSVAIPGGPGEHDFHLDMATATVAVGKIETALREGRSIPKGWVPEALGTPTLDEKGLLTHGVPLLPLGGEGDLTGGHKGYGLSLMVELLSGALSGARLEDRLQGAAGGAPARTGHFMGALKVEGFRALSEVFQEIAYVFHRIRNSQKEPGRDRIYIHGEPEAIAEEENRREGVPITPAILTQIRDLNQRLGLGYEL